MNATLKAVLRNGVFVPETACQLPENSEVEVIVQGPGVIPASVTDAQERSRIRKRVVERMRQNPIPGGSPRFTREQLHERP